jgi:hypothetical protein
LCCSNIDDVYPTLLVVDCLQIYFYKSEFMESVKNKTKMTRTKPFFTTIMMTTVFSLVGLIILHPTQINGDSHYYFYLSGSFQYAAAVEACNANNTRIAKITSEAENNAAFATIPDISKSSVWFGLNDKDIENEFRWETDGGRLVPGESYSNWAPGEPNDANAGEDCVTFSQTQPYQWNE